MNFSAISNTSFAGRLLRFPLRLIPSSATLPILQGRLRGKRWIVGSGTHGCWLGSYEYEKQRTFEETVERGFVVFDIGAHVGFYTLLASVLVGPEGRVVAFEALPRNLRYLRAHLALNGVNNVSVVGAAVSDVDAEVCFDEGPGHSMAHIAGAGSLKVASVTLDKVVFGDGMRPPSVLKIDVEGAEFAVLQGAMRTIGMYRPALFLATHGPEIHSRCWELLRGWRYRIRTLTEKPVEFGDELLCEYWEA